MKYLATQARATGVEFTLVRQGAKHEVWQFGSKRFTIARHNEIPEVTVHQIRKQIEEGT